RRDVDDMSRTALDHRRENSPARKEDSAKVCFKDCGEIVVSEVDNRTVDAKAGAVHKDVDGTERRCGVSQKCLYLLSVTHVRCKKTRLRPDGHRDLFKLVPRSG